MAYNELFALAFVAPYVASEKKIPPTVVQEMMPAHSIISKWYFAKTKRIPTRAGAENKKRALSNTPNGTRPKRKQKYPTHSFKVDFVGQPYYQVPVTTALPAADLHLHGETQCFELMPLFCELDEVMITLQHGVLHRKQTRWRMAEYCDYFITETENKRRARIGQ